MVREVGRTGRGSARRSSEGGRRRASLVAAAALAVAWVALQGSGAVTAAPAQGAGWNDLSGADLPLLLDMDRASPESPAVAFAKALLAQGRFKEALDALVPVIGAGSNAPPEDRAHGLMLAALALSALGDVERASALLKDAAARQPGSLVIRLNQARVLADAGKLPEASAALRQVDAGLSGRRDPRLRTWAAGVHHKVGLLALSSGLPEEAAEHFRQASQLDPGAALYHASYAGALRILGRAAEAAEAYERAIERLGSAAPAGLLVEAGFVRLSLGEFEAAYRLFQRGLQQSPSQLEALYGLGMAAVALGRADEARYHLEQVVRQVPWHWRAQFALGTALAELKDLSGARRAYEEAVRLAPAVPELRVALGRLYLQLGRYRDAEAQLQAALALGDGRPEVLYEIGRAQLLDARPSEAAASFGRAAALEASAARKALYLYSQALAAEAGGDVEAALRLLRQAVTLDGTLFDAYLRLGELLLARGEPSSAVAPLEQAAALRPDDPRVQRALEAARRQAERN